MAQNVGELQILMYAEMAQLRKDMLEAKTTVSSATKHITESVEMAKHALEMLGIGIGLVEFKEMISGAIEVNEHLADLSKTTGIAVETLAGLRIAAKQSGGDLDSISASLNKLSVNMGKDPEKFKALGLSAKSPLENFQKLSDLFIALPDQQQKAALMAEVLGKSWAGAAPMLAEGGEKIAEMVKRGTELSGVTPELTAQAKELKDKWVELTQTGAMLNMVVGPAFPLFITLADAMLKTKEKSKDLNLGFSPLRETLKAVSVLAIETYTPIKVLGMELGALAASAVALAHGNLSGSDAIFKQVAADSKVFVDEQQKLIDKIMASGTAAANAAPEIKKLSAEEIAAAQAKAAAFLAGKDASDAAAKAGDNLVKSAHEMLAMAEAQLASTEKLTAGESALIKTHEALKNGTATMSAEKRKDYEATMQQVIADEKAKQTRDENNKLIAEAIKQRYEALAAMAKDTESIIAETQKIRDHNVELLNNKQTLEDVKIARDEDTISTLQARLAKIDDANACNAESEEIRAQIDALRDHQKALGEQITAQNLKKQAEEWKKFTDQVEQSLTDALMAGFNSGKSFGQSFIDSLKHSLETAALKIVVQAIVSPVMGAMGQASGLAGAVGSGGNMLSGMSSLGSAFGSSAGQGLIGLSNATGIESIGDFGASMIAGEGVGGAIATAAPWVAGAAVIADALGLFGKRGGPQSGQYGSIGSGGYSSSFTMSGGDSLGNQALASSAYGQAAALYAMAGKDASGLSINQGYKLDPKGTAAGLAYRDIVVNGKAITGGNFDGNNGAQWTGSHDDAAGAANYLGKLGNSEILALVKAIGDPALEATVGKLAANFADLNKAIGQYATAQAQQKALSFALMSQDEQKAAALRDAHAALESTFGSLGIGIPATAEAFRKIVDSLDLTTQAGQSELQALDGVGKAFLLVAASASTAAEQLIDLAGKRSREIQIMQLQGDAAGALAAQRSDELAKLDPVNAKLQQQIYDLTDQQTAAAAAAEAMRNAAAAQKSYTSAVKETASVVNLFGAEHFKTQNEYMLYLSQAQRSGIDTSRIAGSPANQASFFQPAKPSADIAGSINAQSVATAKVAASVTAISNATAQNTAAINALSSFLRRLSPDGSSITTKAA